MRNAASLGTTGWGGASATRVRPRNRCNVTEPAMLPMHRQMVANLLAWMNGEMLDMHRAMIGGAGSAGCCAVSPRAGA